MLNIKQIISGAIVTVALFGSCHSHYEMTSIQRTRILIDSTYDRQPDRAAMRFIAKYEPIVDSMMSPVVGYAATDMMVKQPESDLSNLLADILIWASKAFHETPDFSVYNMGGIRAAISKGKVTYGDVLDVAPFENKICFMTLSGAKVIELFQQIALLGGEGVSHGVSLVISADRKLKQLSIHGKKVDPSASYRLATLDYLGQGNDGMTAFKAGTNLVLPKGEKNNVRFLIMDYFREKMDKGEQVTSRVEGRIVRE
ncbi:5'-nucleotidase C-terminal domain-containing protein [Prevotella sp. A2931]|uniref:5'-nucleotidase C-terminal domain-containing protein n=1 Tax=Prevotella illustrans TaxID=2800387 RepID=A0ABS3M5L5_9BACT|nr:5'-nucleotidase [Prevotella sp. oral taxon 820]MBO1363376.1 5'-nucleotidase C-terminal domain-containing protein [Prevotella illustrans]PTL26135.1 hypothetical protein C3V39_03110 [Prevotella sp. oral taxon 820]